MSAGFNGARAEQQGAPPVRSLSLDSSMGTSPTRPFPPHHRHNAPYTLLQQQGMMGTHPNLANQAGAANTGRSNIKAHRLKLYNKKTD